MKNNWNKVVFKAKPALIEIKSKGIHLFNGQKFDTSKFKLDQKGWTHEHCEECFQRIEENDVMYESEGEINCEKCCEKEPAHNK